MSRTFPRAAGAIPAKLVSRMTLIAAADDTERFSRRMRNSSAASCELQADEQWISLQNFLPQVCCEQKKGAETFPLLEYKNCGPVQAAVAASFFGAGVSSPSQRTLTIFET